MAFQPIVDIDLQGVFAYEALVRGSKGESAGFVLDRVPADCRLEFDQWCRETAISLAVSLGLPAGTALSLNVLPSALTEQAAGIRRTLDAARQAGLGLDQIILEFTENEPIDPAALSRQAYTYRDAGFRTAFDDFGAGHSGLSVLAGYRPDLVKLDMHLIRDIDINPAKQAIVGATIRLLNELAVSVVAEGVETAAELACLASLGCRLMQGYAIARPGLAHLPLVDWHSLRGEVQPLFGAMCSGRETGSRRTSRAFASSTIADGPLFERP